MSEQKSLAITPSSKADVLMLEEYRTLRGEIERLDTRVERGVTILLTINAAIYSIIFLDGVTVGNAIKVGTVEKADLSGLHPAMLWLLLAVNLVMSARYIGTTKHIDVIGGYLARIEAVAYRNSDVPLGWESLLRGQVEALSARKTDTAIDAFRRYSVWVGLLIFNLVVIALQYLPDNSGNS